MNIVAIVGWFFAVLFVWISLLQQTKLHSLKYSLFLEKMKREILTYYMINLGLLDPRSEDAKILTARE
jgi:hypothetical protein